MKKYTLYLGLNDKDTKAQKINTIEAYKIIENIIKDKFEGATIFEASGIYKHDNGEFVIEKTLRIEILFTTEIKIKNLCEDLKRIFNQESIALQSETIKSELV